MAFIFVNTRTSFRDRKAENLAISCFITLHYHSNHIFNLSILFKIVLSNLHFYQLENPFFHKSTPFFNIFLHHAKLHPNTKHFSTMKSPNLYFYIPAFFLRTPLTMRRKEFHLSRTSISIHTYFRSYIRLE